MAKQRWAAQWKVTSRSEPGVEHTVSVAPTGRWACSCKGHIFARKGPDGLKADCFHIKKIRLTQEFATVAKLPMVAPIGAAREMPKETGKVVVRTATTVVIQTRREICLEEEDF